MFKRFGLSALALAAMMAVVAPTVTLAAGRDDYRGRDTDRREIYRAPDEHRPVDRDYRGDVRFGNDSGVQVRVNGVRVNGAHFDNSNRFEVRHR